MNKSLIALGLTILLFHSGCRQGGADAPKAANMARPEETVSGASFTDWGRKQAIRISTIEPENGFADLQPLKTVIGPARVLAFGEAAHGTHELLTLRNRLFEFAVRELRFRAIAVESGFTEGLAVNDYVNGADFDSVTAARGVFHYWYPGPLEENRQLIQWMRNYNATVPPDRKIRFYGIDLTGGWGYKDARRSLDAAGAARG